MKTQRVNALSRGSVVKRLTLILAATHNRQRVSRLPSKKTRCHTNVQTLEFFAGKPPIFCNFWGRSARLAGGNPGSSMSLQQHEIGLETCPPRRPRKPHCRGARKLQYRIPLIVHHLSPKFPSPMIPPREGVTIA